MSAHEQCKHEKTKAARAACRRGVDQPAARKTAVKAAPPEQKGPKLRFRPVAQEITLKQSAREARTIQPSCTCGHPGHKGSVCSREGCPCGTRVTVDLSFTEKQAQR